MLLAFNPESTEYLFEPNKEAIGPDYDELTLPIRASCSPDERRYKEFNKNGGTKVYLPCWAQDELLFAGQVLQDKGLTPKDVDYSDKAIKDRYHQFGGIFRHVLPSSADGLEESNNLQNSAFKIESNRIRVLSISMAPDIEPIHLFPIFFFNAICCQSEYF